ncbi:MAG: MlaE family lipid ABC transporter permease subunit [Geminicoccaceae bacterium]|nr:MlaE family lipid ABC transporter permease subunit [Geminicoccaceae bacterium]
MPFPFAIRDETDARLLLAEGDWRLDRAPALDAALSGFVAGHDAAKGDVRLCLAGIEALDTAGAWLVLRTRRRLERAGIEVDVEGVRPEHRALFGAIERVWPEPLADAGRPHPLLRLLDAVGGAALKGAGGLLDLLAFLGSVVKTALRLLAHPKRLRPAAFVHHLEETGVKALPIVGLLSFLIGVVLAYQSSSQLKQFGAEVFTIDLLGISVFRELGVLLTAIIVAGRSGSAFTAQIGAMQVGEEVDAMRVIGLDPLEVLVLPRVLALVVALPLLGFFAGVMALTGGAVVATLSLGIPMAQFLRQLQGAVGLGVFLAGLVKAPVFAFLIALVGCRNGLNVEGSAESVGRLTTSAVVVSIFLVIVADALFSILFQAFGL